MRQGGMKPKGHNSGVYWVRANAKQGGGKTKKKLGETVEEDYPEAFDSNGDGKADIFGVLSFILVASGVFATFSWLIWLNYT